MKADAALEADYLAALQKEEVARVAAERVKSEWDEAQPERINLRLEQARKAVAQIKEDTEGLNQGIRDLQAELRAFGQMGLGEKEEELAAKFEGAGAELRRVEREAGAIRFLYQVLTQAEKEAKEEYLSPVTRRVHPYLKMLLPEAELVLDENIEITGLRRGTVVEPFTSLSLGTQEQVAVLARLAFADLLRENGQPAAVILDFDYIRPTMAGTRIDPAAWNPRASVPDEELRLIEQRAEFLYENTDKAILGWGARGEKYEPCPPVGA